MSSRWRVSTTAEKERSEADEEVGAAALLGARQPPHRCAVEEAAAGRHEGVLALALRSGGAALAREELVGEKRAQRVAVVESQPDLDGVFYLRELILLPAHDRGEAKGLPVSSGLLARVLEAHDEHLQMAGDMAGGGDLAMTRKCQDLLAAGCKQRR